MLVKILTTSVAIALLMGGSATAQNEEDRAARLQSAREAIYEKYLLSVPVQPVTSTPEPTGASLAVLPVERPGRDTRDVHLSRASIYTAAHLPHYFASHSSQPQLAGNWRYNYNFNYPLNAWRGGRHAYANYPIGPYVFQPIWDSRYRRSWPRPVVVRDYVRSHWLWDGQRYTHVPGHTKVQTKWITQGWPRYHWNGTHYSVSVSYR